MGDVMKGFGCERAGLEGDVAARCDPLPEAGGDVLPDNVLERLRNMKVDSFGLQGAEIDSAFENSGGGGQTLFRVRGTTSIFEGGAIAEAAAFFTPSGSSQRRLLGEEPQSVMHFVLSLAFPPSAHVTPRDLLHVITGRVPPLRVVCGSGIAYAGRSAAVCGTGISYGAARTLCDVSSWRMLRHVCYAVLGMLLHACYATCSTELGYGAMHNYAVG
eukprot:2654140-Rhodomonas_salina.1